MKEILWTLWEILITLIESCVSMHFVCTFLGENIYDRVGLKRWLGLSLTLAVTNFALSDLLAGYEGIWMTLYVAVVFIYSLLFLSGHPIKKFFVSVFFLFCILINSSIVCNFISSATQVPLDILYSKPSLLRMLTMASVQLINYYIFQILLRLFGKGQVHLRKTEWLLLFSIFGFSTICIVLIQLSILRSELTQTSRLLLLGVDMSIVIINLIAIRLIVILNRHHQTTLENEQLKLQLQYQTQYADTIKQQEETLHMLRHDFKSTVSSLQILLEQNRSSEIEEYLKTYSDNLNATACLVNTNCPLVNAVLNTKLSYAKEIGIQCFCQCPKELPKIQSIDYCSLLGNLLDNAIESKQRSEIKKPSIVVSIRVLEEQIMIQVKNRINASVLTDNPQLKTSKSQASEHGFGVSTIRNIATRYDGSADFFEEQDWFIAQVILQYK